MTKCAPIMPNAVFAGAEPVTIGTAPTWRAISEVFRTLLLRWWLMLLMEGRTDA